MDKTNAALLHEKRKCKHNKLRIARQHKIHISMPMPNVTYLQDKYICKKHDWLEWRVNEDGKICGPLPTRKLWAYDDQEFNTVSILTNSRCWPETMCVCAYKVRVSVPYETNTKRITLQRRKTLPSKNKQHISYLQKACI